MKTLHEFNQIPFEEIFNTLKIKTKKSKENQDFIFLKNIKNLSDNVYFNTKNLIWTDAIFGYSGFLPELIIKHYSTSNINDALGRFHEDYKVFKKVTKVVNHSKGSISISSIEEITDLSLIDFLNKLLIKRSTWNPFLTQAHYTHHSKKSVALAFENDSNGFELKNEKYSGYSEKRDITTLPNNPDFLVVFEDFISFLQWRQVHYSDQSILVLNDKECSDQAQEMMERLYLKSHISHHLKNTQELKAWIIESVPEQIDISSFFEDMNKQPLEKSVKKPKGMSM